jgi:hypothetical protein
MGAVGDNGFCHEKSNTPSVSKDRRSHDCRDYRA